MNGLKTFFEGLNDTEKDLFLQLIGEFSTTVSQTIRDGMQEELQEVTKEIDKVNAEREVLGNRAEMFNRFARELDKFSRKRNVSLEIVLLKQFFSQEEDKLRRKIADLRPNDLLKRKYEIKNNLKDMYDKMSSFSKINYIMHLILKKTAREKEQAAIEVEEKKKEEPKKIVEDKKEVTEEKEVKAAE